ncbi:hypothetical protein IQ259_16520 [Fortiea sp. LEGE XX443]|uniref:hypothetical protein n=1 Tax=Fortiea sp. LEGE XX443 TaxID=1828611 RepID=UPI00188156A9|nr:hypothetical protein [Fortiea sp. LEGE XX443]MBE9006625.1 hypothetical protein [Fortiea sp. LEGE XX443]
MKRQFYLGIAASILCLSQLSNIDTAQAQACQESQTVADGCLKINTQALQDFMNLNDIVPQELVQQSEVGQLTGLTGSSLTPSLDKGSLLTAPKEIIRELKDLWQLEVPSTSNFTANYQCSNLTHSSQTSSSIQVLNIEPTPITVVGPGSAPDTSIIEGGATFTFDLSNTKASGNHSCNLQINVIENNQT